MNQRSLNIIPGSPLAQARLCQVKRRRTNQQKKSNRSIYTVKAPLTAIYTSGKNHRLSKVCSFRFLVRSALAQLAQKQGKSRDPKPESFTIVSRAGIYT